MENLRDPYTIEELAELRAKLGAHLEAVETEYPGIRALPPMAEEEAKGLLLSLAETAVTRQLSKEEAFLMAQLLAGYRMAVEARMLNKPTGRYYVISADDLASQLRK